MAPLSDMQALRYNPVDKTFKLHSLPVPKIADSVPIRCEDAVKVEVKFAGVCGTDLHIIKDEFANGCTTTMTLGHEFCGLVTEAGENAVKAGIKVGDRVGVDPNRGCFACEFCAKGQVHFCQPKGVHHATGVHMDGGFAKYSIVHYGQTAKLTKGVTYEQGALCEPLSCLLHGWDRLNRFAPDLDSSAKILVLGAGIIGNLWVSLLHFKGFRDVIVSEPSEGRRNIVKSMDLGYTVVSPKEVEELMPKTPLEADVSGVEVIIDCTGFPPALEGAMKWTRRGAVVCVFGCAPPGQQMKICPEEIFNKELTVFGTLVNPHTYGRAVGLAEAMGERYLSYPKLGIKTYSLKDYEVALEALKKAEISKAIFRMD